MFWRKWTGKASSERRGLFWRSPPGPHRLFHPAARRNTRQPRGGLLPLLPPWGLSSGAAHVDSVGTNHRGPSAAGGRVPGDRPATGHSYNACKYVAWYSRQKTAAGDPLILPGVYCASSATGPMAPAVALPTPLARAGWRARKQAALVCGLDWRPKVEILLGGIVR